jgi:G3E family GTPase
LAPVGLPKTALAAIPANLIVGEAGPRRRIAEHLLSSKAPGEHWAVLDNTGVASAWPSWPDVKIRVVADGCICCNAVSIRVELTRLLREARPQRLLVLPSDQARIPDLLRSLTDRWLAPVLELRATIAVVNAASGDVGADHQAEGESPLAHARVVALEPEEGAAADDVNRMRGHIAQLAPHAELVIVRNGNLDREFLDRPGTPVRPRFAPG